MKSWQSVLILHFQFILAKKLPYVPQCLTIILHLVLGIKEERGAHLVTKGSKQGQKERQRQQTNISFSYEYF